MLSHLNPVYVMDVRTIGGGSSKSIHVRKKNSVKESHFFGYYYQSHICICYVPDIQQVTLMCLIKVYLKQKTIAITLMALRRPHGAFPVIQAYTGSTVTPVKVGILQYIMSHQQEHR